MERVVGPGFLQNEAEMVAYAKGDFSGPHDAFVEYFLRYFPDIRSDVEQRCLDIGCGPCDVTVRMAKRFPRMIFTALDCSARMLRQATDRIGDEGLVHQIFLQELQLPGIINGGPFDNIISNSLLHQLSDPDILWNTIKSAGICGTRILIMDLKRASSIEDARIKVQNYCGDEPEVLQNDFFNSLLAAYTVTEVLSMIKTHGLHGLRVDSVSDRHLVVHGRL